MLDRISTARSAAKGVAPSLLVAVVLLLIIFSLNAHEYFSYVPFGDDPSILRGSAGALADWFTLGFSRYFLVYPEWSSPFTDFLRPGVNAILRLDQIAFGHHYALYFAAYYAAQFMLVLLVLLLARQIRVPQWIQLMLAALLATNPAFVSVGLSGLANQFDIWCALFALAALVCISRKRYVLTFVLLTTAVFTKEAALYAPVAAALTVLIDTRRKVLAATMLLPLLAWIGVRKFLFKGSAHGVYAVQLDSPKDMLLVSIKGILQWPTGLVPEHGAKNVLSHHDLLHNLSAFILLIANFALWILLIGIGSRLFRERRNIESSPVSPLSLYLWLCGALSFGVLVAPDPRFGGSIYPLELLVLAMAGTALQAAPWRLASRWALCLLVCVFAWHMYSLQLDKDVKDRMPSMRLLDEALKRDGRDAKTVFILNSSRSFSAPQYLASSTGITARVVVLNEFSGCLSATDSTISIPRRGASELDIEEKLPACATLIFDGANQVVLAKAIGGQRVMRGNFAIYDFPSAEIVPDALDPKLVELDLGSRLNISLIDFDSATSVLLYYDWTTSSYRCVGKRCGTTS